MEEMNLSETATEEEEPGRPSGAILSLALGKQTQTKNKKLDFTLFQMKAPFSIEKDKY
jgi:hypothetical protein